MLFNTNAFARLESNHTSLRMISDTVIRQHSKQTICIDGECKTTENTIISVGPQKQHESENTNTNATK